MLCVLWVFIENPGMREREIDGKRDRERQRDSQGIVGVERERESDKLLWVLWAFITQFSGKREKDMVRETQRFTR